MVKNMTTEVQTTVKYRYIVTDLLTNQILAEIPFTGVSYERALKAAGRFQGNISINLDTKSLDLYNSTMPGKTGLYVMRNDECVWGGIIWSREYSVTGQEISVSASEFTSYLHHRRIWKTFLREFDGVKVTRYNASLLKVRLGYKSRITINSGSTVELIFDESRAYNYRGHYKVVGDYVDASVIYVEDIPIEAFTGNPIAFDGDYREDEATKTQTKTYSITSRKMVKGKKDVTLTTKTAHGLLPGDIVNISGVDQGIGLEDYVKTTGDSTPLTVDHVDVNFEKFIYQGKTKVGYKFRGFIPSVELVGFAIQPVVGDSTNAYGYVFISIDGPDNSPYPFETVSIEDDPSWYLTYNSTDKPTVGVDYFGIKPGDTIDLSGFGIDDTIKFNGPGSGFTGDARINGKHVVTSVSVEAFPFDREPADFDSTSYWDFPYWVVQIEFKLPQSTTVIPYVAQLGNDHIFDYTGSNYTFNGPYRLCRDIGNLEPGQSIIFRKFTGSTNQYLADAGLNENGVFKILEVEPWDDPYGAQSQSFTIATKANYDKWTNNIIPTIPGAVNTTIERIVHYKNKLINKAADEVNKLGNEIVAVPSYDSFTVLSYRDSSVSSNVRQSEAKVKWDPVYSAVMHANTDTYDYVRLLLGHVFTDFSRVPNSSSFLGTDITNGVRKVTYDEVNQKVRLHAGFVESAYSKEIKRDSFTISAVKLSKNLATATFSLDDYTATAGSVSGSASINISKIQLNNGRDTAWITTSTDHGLEVGDVFSVSGLNVNQAAFSASSYKVTEVVNSKKIKFTNTYNQAIEEKNVSSGSLSYSYGNYITYTFDSHSLIPGDVISVEIAGTTSSYETEGAVVLSVNSTQVTVSSPTRATGSFSGTATVYRHHNFAVGDTVTISGVDADLGLGRNIFDITTRVESVPSRSKITFSVPEEDSVPLSSVIKSQTPTGTTNITIKTDSDHDISPGDSVVISGVTPSAYRGSWTAQAGTTGNTLVVNIGSNPGKIKVGGSVGRSVEYVNGNATGKYYVKLALPTPYDQFYVSYTGGLTDVGTYVTVYGNDISVNGSFPIKKISPNKDYIEYYIPDGTETKAIEYLAPDSATIVFGAHGMIPGNTITVRGLADLNYDGTFTISDVPNLTSLEYQHELPAMQITNYRVKRNEAGTGTLVWLRLSGKPTYGSFVGSADRPTTPPKTPTKVKIQGVPILDDGTYTVYKYLDPERIRLENPNKLRDAYYIQLYLSGNTSIQLTPPLLDVPIDVNDRLYGTVGNITSATYVAKGTTGTGTTTFVTTAAHGLSAGDTIYLSNVGNVFTNKSGVSNAYTWLTGTVKTKTSTTFTMDQSSLYRYKYSIQPEVARTSVTLTGITGATVRNYKTDSKILTSVYATAQITTMSDFYSDQIDQRAKKVINRAYNKETQEVRLTTETNHEFKPGEVVTISGVDDPDTIEPVFDGSYVLIASTEFALANPGKTVAGEKTEKDVLVYRSGSALKSDIGVFLDPVKKDTDPTRRLISSDILAKNADGTYPATAVVEPIVFGATYGSYTGNTDLGIEFSTYDYSGAYMRGKSYRGHELIVVADALDEYADKYIVRPGTTKAIRNVSGFEYRIDCYFDKETQSFKRVFVFIPINFPNEPVHGEVSPISRFGADKIVFEYPGNISEITMQESAEEAATRFWMVGSDGGTGTDNASKTYVGLADAGLLSRGWPIIEQVETNDQLDFIADITDYAKRYLVETKPPIGTFEVSVNGSYDPVVNSYSPGDWCSLIVRDQFITERLATDLEPRDTVLVRKIAGYSVQVPDGNGFPEQVKLTLIPEWDVDKR
jgi:hypothetical protein